MKKRYVDMKEGPAVLLQLHKTKRKKLFLVAGGRCAGKAYLSRSVRSALYGNAAVVCQEYYTKDFDDPTLPKINGSFSFDLPASFHNDEMRQDLVNLIAGKTIARPVYDPDLHKRVAGSFKHVMPADLVIVNGPLVIHELDGEYEQAVKIYVTAGTNVRLNRFIARHKKLLPEAAIRKIFSASIEPMHRMHVEPQIRKADIVIVNNDGLNV